MTITALYSSYHRSPLLRYPGGRRRRPFGCLEHNDPHLQDKLPVKTPTFAVSLPPAVQHDEIFAGQRDEAPDPLKYQEDGDTLSSLQRDEPESDSAIELLDGTVMLPMFRQRLCLDTVWDDDEWTLKRANAVCDDDETEQRDGEYESPTKRQCQELYWDECCENVSLLQPFSDSR
jgi:hypothetical protein